MHRSGHHEVEEELSSSVELTHMDTLPDDHALDAGFPVAREESSQPHYLSSMSVLFLTFVLVLSLWDTWSTLTDIFAPLPDNFVLRIALNIALCVVAKLTIRRIESGRLVLVANLLLGMGVWEMAESVIEMVFGTAITMKLFFYVTCLIFTSVIIIYLETAKGMNVLDNDIIISPI